MSKPDKSELIDMAINMLEQAKISQKAINKVREKLEIDYDSTHTDSLWARHCYQMIRGGVGIIEINAEELTSLSQQELYRDEDE